MANTIRVGVVGAGANTRKFHIPNLQKIAGVEIEAVANRTRASSERAAKELAIPRVHDSWQALVNDPGIDAVVTEGETGFIVPAARIEAMLVPLAALAQDRVLRDRLCAGLAAKDFSVWSAERMISAIGNVYERAMRKPVRV